MSNTVRVTSVNHVAQDIACSPDRLYREIVASYIEGWKSLRTGLAAPLPENDLAAYRGGYRITVKDDQGALLDDRICRITEHDDDARRVSLVADYLAPQQMGIRVYATYQAVEAPVGARYQIDCHTDMTLEAPAEGGQTIAEMIAGLQTQSGDHLKTYLGSVRDKLEAEAVGEGR